MQKLSKYQDARGCEILWEQAAHLSEHLVPRQKPGTSAAV